MNKVYTVQNKKNFVDRGWFVLNEKLIVWQKTLENERATLLELQMSGDFTDEHAGRLSNIEYMLDQIAINQFLG